MKKSLLTASVLALALAAGTASLPARADSADITFEMIWKMADGNTNGVVTKQEFLNAMAKAYDMKMSKFKEAKDAKMLKGDGMTADGLKSLIADLYRGA